MDNQPNLTESDLERILLDETAEPKPLSFPLLQRITNSFSYNLEIGRGGFAVVYKAMLQNGAVAVKKLSNTYMYEKEFLREVECLMKAKHKNIVRFLGYCVDTQGNMTMHEGKYIMADIQQRLLCFEYLPNGGLDHHIKDPSCGLEWIDRYSIIKGMCEGLHHLHQINILHLNLKPANILLDDNMKPKITDFGISRSIEDDQSRVIPTKVLGTTGYMAPEFIRNQITKKYDLYSLGVIIMEILTGEKMYHDGETVWTSEKMSHLVETVLQSWIDRLNISRRMEECEQIRVCVEIGIECTYINPANRPVNMKHIIERLAEMERTEEMLLRIKMLDIGVTSSCQSLHSLDSNHAKQQIITVQNKLGSNRPTKGSNLPASSYLNGLKNITSLRRFEYSELAKATDGFSMVNIIAEGSFGTVYSCLCKIGKGRQEVAVKKMNHTTEYDGGFLAELGIMSRSLHTNIVTLEGWCCRWKILNSIDFMGLFSQQGSQIFLVYELVPNGNLHDHLYNSMGRILPWDRRYKIAKGIVSAVHYLHHEREKLILHGDIKPSKILLDHEFNPKLTGFGLWRNRSPRTTGTLSSLAADYGGTSTRYTDPRCIEDWEGEFYGESDVYSLEVVLLEIACTGSSIDKVWQLYQRSGAVYEVMKAAADPKLASQFDKTEMERLIYMGLRFSDPDRTQRPASDGYVMRFLDQGGDLPCITEDVRFHRPPNPKTL